jgi:hypothetical protein
MSESGEVMTQRYQRGSLRREPRAAGDVWVWRYRVNGVNGVMRQETFPVTEHSTKSEMWVRGGARIDHEAARECWFVAKKPWV